LTTSSFQESLYDRDIKEIKDSISVDEFINIIKTDTMNHYIIAEREETDEYESKTGNKTIIKNFNGNIIEIEISREDAKKIKNNLAIRVGISFNSYSEKEKK